MFLRSLNRFKASSIHLTLSLLLGVVIFLLFRLVWYPDGLFGISGAAKLLFLIVAVDVTLGPLLTLVVFNPKKKSLPFDLTVILLLQLSGLAYGVYIMLQSRPVFLVGVTDRFELVAANEVLPEELAKARNHRFNRLSWTGPVLVGAKRPEASELRSQLLFEALAGKPDLDRRPEYYVDFPEVVPTLLERGRPLADWEKDAHLGEVKDAFGYARRHGLDPKKIKVLPIKVRSEFGAVLVDPVSAAPLHVFAFDAYQLDSSKHR